MRAGHTDPCKDGRLLVAREVPMLCAGHVKPRIAPDQRGGGRLRHSRLRSQQEHAEVFTRAQGTQRFGEIRARDALRKSQAEDPSYEEDAESIRGREIGRIHHLQQVGRSVDAGEHRRMRGEDPARNITVQHLADHLNGPSHSDQVDSDTEEGGGRAVGEACHMLDFFHAVIDHPLDELQALARPGEDADANFSVQLRFRNGTLAHLVYTTLGNPALPKERVEAFLGDEVVVIDDFRGVEVLKQGLRSRRRISVDKGYRDEWAAFHAACTGGPPLPIPLEQLRSVAEATFRIRDATRS